MEEATKKRIAIVTGIALCIKVFLISGMESLSVAEVFLFVFFFLINWGWLSWLFMAVFNPGHDTEWLAIYGAALIALAAADGMVNPSYDDSINSGSCRSTIHIEDCN